MLLGLRIWISWFQFEDLDLRVCVSAFGSMGLGLRT